MKKEESGYVPKKKIAQMTERLYEAEKSKTTIEALEDMASD